MSALQQADSWMQASRWRRLWGVFACLWIAGVICAALVAANEEGMELYGKTMLGLLLFGAPIAVACLAYALRLAGWVVIRRLIITGVVLVIVIGALAYRQHLAVERERQAVRQSLTPEQQQRLEGVNERNPELAGHLLDGFQERSERLEKERKQRFRRAMLSTSPAGAQAGRDWDEIAREVVDERGNRAKP